METFKKQGEKLKVSEPIVSEREYTIGQIDNEILRLETELEKMKSLRDEAEKLGLREVFNIPKVAKTELATELQGISAE